MTFSGIVRTVPSALLVTASTGMGALYAWNTGSEHGPVLGVLAVTLGIGLELAKPFAVDGAFSAFRSLRTAGRGLALTVLALVAVSYSLTAELSLLAGLRSDKVAARKAGSDAAGKQEAREGRTQERYDRAKADLATIAPARPAGELQATIAQRNAVIGTEDCARWVPTKVRIACDARALEQAELARAGRRAELEAAMGQAERDLAAPTGADTPVKKEADPAAHAIVALLAALGITLSEGLVTTWLSIVPVIACEIGSMLAVVLFSSGHVPARRDSGPKCNMAPTANTPEPQQIQASAPVTPSGTSDGATLAIEDDPRNRLLTLLQERGGEVFGSQRTFAKALGVSHTQVNRMLHELSSERRIEVATSGKGTRVRLAKAA
jgi:hypothetical protein